jgi:hypothetical protein
MKVDCLGLQKTAPAGRRILLAVALGAFLGALARTAAADPSFVDRPLVLQLLHLSADAGIGVGQYPLIPLGDRASGRVVGMGLGGSVNLEGAVGLPLSSELGVRVGFHMGDEGVRCCWGLGAEHVPRLFDPIVGDPGPDTVANPEVRLRGSFLNLDLVQVGAQVRSEIINRAQSSGYPDDWPTTLGFGLGVGIRLQ